MPNDRASAGPDDAHRALARALTFHASFDHGPDADVPLGDRRIYSLSPGGGPGSPPTPGLGEPPLTIAHVRGAPTAALSAVAII